MIRKYLPDQFISRCVVYPLSIILFGVAGVAFVPVIGAWILQFVIEAVNSSAIANLEATSGYIGGVVGTIVAAATGLILWASFSLARAEARRQAKDAQRLQDREHFFRILEFHRKNVAELVVKNLDTKDKSQGRRAFVVFKLQIHHLHKIIDDVLNSAGIDTRNPSNHPWIIDLVYVSFYYGIDRQWHRFIKKKLRRFLPCTDAGQIDKLYRKILRAIERSKFHLGRTNQTSLSAYYRNLFGAVKFVDGSTNLQEAEKKNLIKMLRAQLSNPELYVFFFNTVSRFGQAWHPYIKKYQLLKNLPFDYVAPYDQRDFFEQDYEEDEHTILYGWTHDTEYPVRLTQPGPL